MAIWQIGLTLLTGVFLAHATIAYRGDRSGWRIPAYAIAGVLCYLGSRAAFSLPLVNSVPLLPGIFSAAVGLLLYFRFTGRYAARLTHRWREFSEWLHVHVPLKRTRTTTHTIKGGVS